MWATSLVHDILDQVIVPCDEPQLIAKQIIVNEVSTSHDWSVNRKYKTWTIKSSFLIHVK